MTISSQSKFKTVIRTLSLLATVTGANADLVLIDFSSATPEPGVADSNGNRWTTIAEAGTVSDLIDATGSPTAIDITVNFSRYSAGLGGNAIDGPTGPAPFNQTFAVTDGIFSSRPIGIATISFSDLAPETSYDLAMIGGRASSGSDAPIEVITGTGSGGTVANDGTILNLTVNSNSSGVIAFTFIQQTESQSEVGSLNAMSITQVPEPGMSVLLSLSGLLLVVRRRS